MNKKGFSTLFAIILAGATGLAVILALSALSGSSNRNLLSSYSASKAVMLSNACTMYGLQLSRNDTNFAGSGTLNIEGRTCNYSVINSGGYLRQVQSYAVVDGVTKKVKASYSVQPPKLSLLSWQEVADF